MIGKLIVMLCVVSLMGLFIVGGCKDAPEAGISTQMEAEPGENIGTLEQYRQEAEQTIKEEDALDELDKLEAEINAEATD